MTARPTAPQRGIGIAGWIAVLVLLGLIDVAVRRVYVPIWLPRIGEAENDVLHDVTLGQNLSVVFALAERQAATSAHTLTIVGDSTVMGKLVKSSTRFTPGLAREIAAARGTAGPVRVIELGFLGLTTPDAAVVMAKALALDGDLVVYAVTPRVLCTLAYAATDAGRYAADPGVAARLGSSFLFHTFPLATLAGSVVSSHWALFRYQQEIHAELLRTLARRVPESWRDTIAPGPYLGNIGSEAAPMQGPIWTHARCPTSGDTRELIALRRILDMCAVSGRCFVYEGPINPDGMSSFEPELLARFRTLMARLTTERHVAFRDYTEELSTQYFERPTVGRPDAIHLNPEGRAWLAKRLASDVQGLIPHSAPAGR